MNILNYEAQEIGSLEEIVEKQKEIMFAFEPNLKKRVEEFDIDIYEDQMLLKDFLLVRAVEEITEAGAAIKANHVEHFKEEIIDVFNFLVETKIILGDDYKIDNDLVGNPIKDYLEKDWYMKDTPTDINKKELDEEEIQYRLTHIFIHLFHLVENIGLLTNLLKQRPWRESQYPVDVLTFRERWDNIWANFWLTLSFIGFSFEEFKAIWSKKYQVNKFRIESNY
jgi:hypothetical protein